MAKILGLPKLSPTMDQGTLVRWAKKEGETIQIDDLLAEIETDKATMEFRSFDKGVVLLKQLAPEGATLAPDEPVAIVGAAGEDITKLLAEIGGGKGGVAPAANASSATPDKNASSAPQSQATSASQATTPSPATASSQPSAAASRGADGRVLASPLVRKVAREREIDLGAVAGTGPNGRIVKRDLDALGAAAPAGGRAAAPSITTRGFAGPSQEPRIVPLSNMRRTIARRLTESKQQVPHFYLTIDVDAGPISLARRQINAELEASGEKVSVNDLLIKAAATALVRVPEVNASFMGDSIHYHQRVDVSVAVAVPDGLVTPVVRNADRLGVAEIAREVRELAARAKDKKLKPEEMSNGTFSVSNLGMYGIEEFAAVINPPEGAILAVGTLREEPVVVNGAIVVGQRMRFTLSCDHRVVDGALGARWLAAFKTLLERPLTMLI